MRALAYHYGVQAAIERSVSDGTLPGEVEVCPNVAGSANHLEWKYQNAIISISQVHHYKALPRRAEFRGILGNHNIGRSPMIQTNFLENQILDALSKQCYFLLTHGFRNSKPDFIGLGVPNEMLNKWYYSINLSSLIKPQDIPSLDPLAPVEEIKEENNLTLRTIAKTRIGNEL